MRSARGVPRMKKNTWYVRHKTKNVVYAFVCGEVWPLRDRKTIQLTKVGAGADSKISILGQNDLVLEYRDEIPTTVWKQTAAGLSITATRAQRIYNDRTWPNPVVFKITNPIDPN
jgi:alpha-L-fucosidase